MGHFGLNAASSVPDPEEARVSPNVRTECVRSTSSCVESPTTTREAVVLCERESTMARVQAEVQALAERIQALADADRAKILAQVMLAEGKKVPWSSVQRVQTRMRKVGLEGDKLDRDIVEAVREVRRDRARKPRR